MNVEQLSLVSTLSSPVSYRLASLLSRTNFSAQSLMDSRNGWGR